ncbi:hypothetical protein NI40_008865 [Enterobacter sp. E20]|uniref:hypothetical protein n=1 Tax=Enterobacter sp. E20 TaxID=1560339 RepID=UPI000575656C|nr:hypothetical protein [Enterobacter sp. E20]ALL17256.1 hypothetical protein NI40_008865 [Enterobacter sp. E20]
MNKRHRFIYTAAAVLLVIFITTGYWFSRHNLSFTCSSSTVSFYGNNGNNSNAASLNFTQTLNFNYLGKATVFIAGELHTPEGVTYRMNRSVFYDYVHLGGSNYYLQVTDSILAGNDDVPVSLAKTELAPLQQGASRIVGIRQLPSGDMVVANNVGPFLICAVH